MHVSQNPSFLTFSCCYSCIRISSMCLPYYRTFIHDLYAYSNLFRFRVYVVCICIASYNHMQYPDVCYLMIYSPLIGISYSPNTFVACCGKGSYRVCRFMIWWNSPLCVVHGTDVLWMIQIHFLPVVRGCRTKGRCVWGEVVVKSKYARIVVRINRMW